MNEQDNLPTFEQELYVDQVRQMIFVDAVRPVLNKLLEWKYPGKNPSDILQLPYNQQDASDILAVLRHVSQNVLQLMFGEERATKPPLLSSFFTRAGIDSTKPSPHEERANELTPIMLDAMSQQQSSAGNRVVQYNEVAQQILHDLQNYDKLLILYHLIREVYSKGGHYTTKDQLN